MIEKYGSPKGALDFIYREGRGKSAHADKKSLEYDMARFIGDQLRDAELLRYMARVAIEKAWQGDDKQAIALNGVFHVDRPSIDSALNTQYVLNVTSFCRMRANSSQDSGLT
ncbi:MAG: hypothetical protein C4293_12230 [Nitrospiraceae bacterium]